MAQAVPPACVTQPCPDRQEGDKGLIVFCGARLQACRVDSHVDVRQFHHQTEPRPQEAVLDYRSFRQSPRPVPKNR